MPTCQLDEKLDGVSKGLHSASEASIMEMHIAGGELQSRHRTSPETSRIANY